MSPVELHSFVKAKMAKCIMGQVVEKFSNSWDVWDEEPVTLNAAIGDVFHQLFGKVIILVSSNDVPEQGFIS